MPYEGLIHNLSQPKPVLAPDAGCTLANQIIAANTDRAVGDCPAGDGLDTIEITEDILLQEPLPKISADIIVEGNGHTISGGKKHRIFLVQDANLTIRDLTMTEGNAEQGGAILTLYGSKVHIVDSVISNSEAQNGRAICVRSFGFHISESTVSGNRATSTGGALFFDNARYMDLVHVTVTGNRPIIPSRPKAGHWSGQSQPLYT